MMKKQNKIITWGLVIGFLVTSFASCSDYLEVSQYFDETLTLDSAFTKRKYAEGFLANAYDVLKNEVCDFSTGSRGLGTVGPGGYSLFASDELLRMDDNNYCQQYQNGKYSAENALKEDKWKRVYEPIRKATTIIKYIDKCREMTPSERLEIKGMAYFLRGYAYWVLLRQYGPLPMIPEEGFDVNMSYEELSVQRNTYDECVDYIANDFLRAAQFLPVGPRPSNNIGRPTRGAALAARARLYLFAASPLYNERAKDYFFDLKNNDGVQLFPDKYDESKWARAAAAALDVINLAPQAKYALFTVGKTATTVEPPYHSEYSEKNFPDGWANIDPFESYRQLFNGSVPASMNSEILFTRPNDRDEGLEDFVFLCIPYSLKGNNSVAVTLKQVDAYYMNDGKTIYEAAQNGDYNMEGPYTSSDFTSSISEYPYVGRSVFKQYANREPRFYASIAYGGSTWECQSAAEANMKNQQIFYYRETVNGKMYNNDDRFPVTGIGVKKYYHPEDAVSTGGYVLIKFEAAIRYADILMWYAEAVNELKKRHKVTLFNGEEIEINRDIEALRSGIKPIRMRAGLPDFSPDVYNDQTAFRIALKRERQIEFFAECKRYYDLRRWCDAEVEENMPIFGYNIYATASEREAFYQRVMVTTYPKIFISPAMYLWPIPQYELTRNKKLTQNPGW
jgi:hypothetical protein